MGYELTRFNGEIDEEFLCSICAMVLKNPVQMRPCDHLFCNECITDWVAIEPTCPVDRTPLAIADLKPPSKPFRNLWHKLNIECDFQPDGCTAIMKLENLTDHVSSCEHNMNGEIVCDKGCNMVITRREYLTNNCSTHLANRVSAQANEIVKLIQEMSDQKEHFERTVTGVHEQIKILNDEVGRLRQEITQLCDKSNSNISLNSPLNWKSVHNIIIDASTNLKVRNCNLFPYGVAQTHNSLNPTNCYFKVNLLGLKQWHDSYWIGLTVIGRPSECNPTKWSIAYCGGGTVVGDTLCQILGPQWKEGDVIECGIKFPANFINDGNSRALVYLSRNYEQFFEITLSIPRDGFFPAVRLYGRDARVNIVN